MNQQKLATIIKFAVEKFGSEGCIDGVPDRNLTLGNVNFWIDESGKWADMLSHDLTSNAWDLTGIKKSFSALPWSLKDKIKVHQL